MKIAGVGFIGGMLALAVRRERQELALVVSLVTAVIIAGQVIIGVGQVIDGMTAILNECGVDTKYFTVCIKAVGMAYVSQLAAEILRDGGESAIASKVEMAGRVSILILTMPVLESFLRLCVKVVNGI